MNQGYYRFPSIYKEKIVFVSDDDLWLININGGVAQRLTKGLGELYTPLFSPDGKYIAFVSKEEGINDVYVIPSSGGRVKRLTYIGGVIRIAGWTKDNKNIIFASNYTEPFLKKYSLFSVSIDGGLPQKLPYGVAVHIAWGNKNQVLLGRHTLDIAKWKKYKGGTVGEIWIDTKGKGEFKQLLKLNGNLSSPIYVKDRIYFISDFEDIGNIYSCNEEGKDIVRHTFHKDFYVRYISTDGENIVYQCGGDIYFYNLKENKINKVNIEFYSPKTQCNRKFTDASKYLESYELNPDGTSLLITSRGKIFTMDNWEGPVIEYFKPKETRYRLGRYLYDKKRIVCITDEDGEDTIKIFYTDATKEPVKLPNLNLGRVYNLKTSPKDELIALSNHRNELVLVNLKNKSTKVIDKNETNNRLSDFNWSPDGNWIVYSWAKNSQYSCLKLYDIKNNKTYQITKPIMHDVSPCFSPDGKYIYFLSYRIFDPVYDNLQFDLNFPRGVIPCVITLQKDLPSPFLSSPKELPKDNEPQKDIKKKKKEEFTVKIDLDGIEDRVFMFPVPEARYTQIYGIKDKILLCSYPIEGALNKTWHSTEDEGKGKIDTYSLIDKKLETIIWGVNEFKISQDYSTIIYRSGKKLRVLKAGEKPDEKVPPTPPDKKNGWIDLNRIKLSVEPLDEWKQMYKDAWRLQKENFWREDMNKINWDNVYKKYLPLLDRISTRGELSDIIWEMQGELQTSHAYEMGGDYRKIINYSQGYLGIDLEYNEKKNGYTITNIPKGDIGDTKSCSPFLSAGVNIKKGDTIIAIDGVKLSKNVTPNELLVNKPETEVLLTLENKSVVKIKTLKSELELRYREWVNNNREYVHKVTKGKVGYIHIPDMGARGYAEFHRGFLTEFLKEGLIVDVRYNGGGHVSPLLLEKLARKRLGYEIPRRGQPIPYPYESAFGPMVAITNEIAGSDGDVFSYCFKQMNLGPLIGKKTWGGVIGICPKYYLVDGTLTTQPEFACWFYNVGFGIENFGVEPDIPIDIAPQDYSKNKDTQLDIAIEQILKILKDKPSKIPEFK